MFARTFRPNSMRSSSLSNLGGRRSNFVRCRVPREPASRPLPEREFADLVPPEPDDVLPLEVEPPPAVDPLPPLVPPTSGRALVPEEPVAPAAAP
jgi:hypothetical protein